MSQSEASIMLHIIIVLATVCTPVLVGALIVWVCYRDEKDL